MKAIAYDEYGDESVLRLVELPKPKLRHYSALVRVKAAGVNLVDCKIRNGAFESMMDAYFPVVPGLDVAGVVESIHYTSPEFAPGDEVIGYVQMDYLHHGTYAEYVSAPVRTLGRKPRNATWAQAAALPATGLTAYQVLQAIEVRQGDTLLVHGAAGGVGSLAAQIARILGANVIGTASEDNHAFLRGLGIEPVQYGDGLNDRVRALAPNGVDGIVDCFGGGSLGASAELLAPGVGANQMITIADRAHAADIGARWIGIDPTATGDLAQLVEWFEKDAIVVRVGAELPLAEAAEAHRRVRHGHNHGKVILTVD